MEKTIFKPAVKELLYKNGEENIYFDVLSSQGLTPRERNLGALFVISQIKYADEDLSYLVSLILSLAKREYYSETSLQEQNPKEAFSRTLRKLNEVLEDFFQNKNFKLNVGLAAIVGENIFISRLGKFRINLARNNQLIDILNNVELFNKSGEKEEQFSNIISGKLQPNDRLFAFFPTRSVTSREKQLNELLVKEGQEKFGERIAQLAASVNNFSCCGIHIGIQQIKEIPLQPTPRSLSISPFPATAPAGRVPSRPHQKTALERAEPKLPKEGGVILASENENIKEGGELQPETDEKEAESTEEIEPEGAQTVERPRIIPAEFSVAKRGNIFTLIAARAAKLRLIGFVKKSRTHIFVSLAIIVVVAASLLVLLGRENKTENTINSANQNLELAQSRLSQNNFREARSLLQAALLDISDTSGKKAEGVKTQINQTLATLDKTSDKQPVIDETANGDEIFASVVPEALVEIVGNKDAVLYEDNLYVLAETGMTIYKYTDAAKGKTIQSVWGSLESGAIAIAVDGNIYTLTDAGKLVIYFKGKKTGELDLQIAPSAGSRIYAVKDSAFVYLADKANRKVYVFDKSSGELETSYDLSAAGKIQDISVSPNGTIWILSTDNKVWQIKP